MLNKIVLIILLNLFSASGVSSVKAHETAVAENGIEAAIHITPDDQPVALQLSKISLDVIDAQKLFSFENCECILTIKNDTTTIAELPLIGTGTSIETSYIFSDEGSYAVVFSGMPKQGSNFESFTLPYEYTVRPVTHTTATPVPSTATSSVNTQVFRISLVVLTTLVLITILIVINKKNSDED
jgi:hypothetical protein